MCGGIKHRCSKCGTRHTFDRAYTGPAQSRWKSCKKCGHQRFYVVKNEKTCRCDAYPFPHRAGGGRCLLHAVKTRQAALNYGPEPTDYTPFLGYDPKPTAPAVEYPHRC